MAVNGIRHIDELIRKNCRCPVRKTEITDDGKIEKRKYIFHRNTYRAVGGLNLHFLNVYVRTNIILIRNSLRSLWYYRWWAKIIESKSIHAVLTLIHGQFPPKFLNNKLIASPDTVKYLGFDNLTTN